jgi:demethylmenaquinone methyltransferase/2-methoxy-6-polyprenyl-1,4-benzoquinol methylase
MKDKLFDGKSKIGRLVFRELLPGLESPLRYRFNNPEKLVKASRIRSGQTVLEIGCGSGFFTVPASVMVGDNGFLHAIDLHPISVETTSKKIEDLGITNVEVTQNDAEDTGLPDAYFDSILLFGVIPAPIISLDRLTTEMHRLLKPAGTLAVWTAIPFWSPKSIIKTNLFNSLGKNNGVHRFEKIEY